MLNTVVDYVLLCVTATVDKEEDQCELEGCTRPKMVEGARVHDYCCRTHAEQDAPNRAGNQCVVY